MAKRLDQAEKDRAENKPVEGAPAADAISAPEGVAARSYLFRRASSLNVSGKISPAALAEAKKNAEKEKSMAPIPEGEIKPEPKAEPKPAEPKVEPKAESKAETKPEPKPENSPLVKKSGSTRRSTLTSSEAPDLGAAIDASPKKSRPSRTQSSATKVERLATADLIMATLTFDSASKDEFRRELGQLLSPQNVKGWMVVGYVNNKTIGFQVLKSLPQMFLVPTSDMVYICRRRAKAM